MGRLSSAQLLEFQQHAVVAIPLVEVDLPDGTTIQFSWSSVPSGTLGFYQPKLLDLSSLEFIMDLSRCALITTEITAKIDDTPASGDTVGWFSRIAATYRGALRDSVVRIRAGSMSSSGDWLLMASARLMSWERSDNNTRSLVFRPFDASIQTIVRLPTVTLDDWPNAPQANLNALLPLAYGELSDRGIKGTMSGLVPATYVDSSGFRYCPCFGWAYQGLDVFVDGTRQTSGYAWDYVLINGRKFTLIDFTADKGAARITCNLRGYESLGDRTGTFLTHTVDQIQHFLANWVFSRNESGDWATSLTSMPIDTTMFAAAKAALAGRASGCDYVSSRLITEDTRALDLLDEACASMHVSSLWTPLGKLGLLYDDPHENVLYYTPNAIVRKGVNSIGDIKYPESGIREAIRIQKISWGSGSLGAAISVQDLTSPSEGEDSLSLSWAPPIAR